MMTPSPPLVLVGPLYTGSERGLVADLTAARALGRPAHAVCTALVMASHGVVTDVTEVPADAVRAQFEHLTAVGQLGPVRVGALGTHQTVEAVLRAVEASGQPAVLDFVASGPSGETLLTQRGIDALSEGLGLFDLVLIAREDAELVTGGEIRSLDDAQVAAQRAHHRGARRVVVKCGALPARFYDAADDPGGDGHPAAFMSDIYYDGEDFALFEAPRIEATRPGAASWHAVAALAALADGRPPEEALQAAKRAATDFLRDAITGN